MAEDEAFYAAAERRVEYLTLGLGALAAVVAAFAWGLREAAGVALGALLGWVNYRWMKAGINVLARVSSAQADAPKVRIPKLVYVKFFGRYVLLIAAVYVILRYSLLPAVAFFGGLFALVAAVLAEIVYELACGMEQPKRG